MEKVDVKLLIDWELKGGVGGWSSMAGAGVGRGASGVD